MEQREIVSSSSSVRGLDAQHGSNRHLCLTYLEQPHPTAYASQQLDVALSRATHRCVTAIAMDPGQPALFYVDADMNIN